MGLDVEPVGGGAIYILLLPLSSRRLMLFNFNLLTRFQHDHMITPIYHYICASHAR